jgi:PAS domain S-box-containing protein
MNYIFAVISIIGFMIAGLLAILVFARNPKEPLNQLFFFFSAAVAWNQLFNSLSILGRDPFLADLYYQLSNVAWLVFIAVFFRFCVILAKRDDPLIRAIVLLAYILTVILSYVSVATHWFYTVPQMTYFGYSAGLGKYYWVFVLFTTTVMVAQQWLLWSIWRKAKSKRERAQSLVLFLALTSCFLLGFAIDVILPNFGFYIQTLVPLATTIFVVIFGYVMVKYGFLAVTPSALAQNIIETMPDFLLFNDLRGRIVLVNQNYLRVFGYASDEVFGREFADMREYERAGEHEEILASLDRDGLVTGQEMFLVKKNGDKVPVIMSASLVKDRFGDKSGQLYIFRDISVEKKLLAEQRRMIGELTAAKKKMDDLLVAADQQILKINKANAELEEFKNVVVNRELRLIELEQEIERLKNRP